jgi:uncharacterized protein
MAGFALPRLQAGRTAIRATNVLAVFWIGWHLPSFFENETMMGLSALQIAGWAASVWLGAIFLTWLYNSSKGSLLVVVLWHGLFNLFTASEASPIVAAVLSMGVIATAILALRLAGPDQLTGLTRAGTQRQVHEPLVGPVPAGNLYRAG